MSFFFFGKALNSELMALLVTAVQSKQLQSPESRSWSFESHSLTFSWEVLEKSKKVGILSYYIILIFNQMVIIHCPKNDSGIWIHPYILCLCPPSYFHHTVEKHRNKSFISDMMMMFSMNEIFLTSSFPWMIWMMGLATSSSFWIGYMDLYAAKSNRPLEQWPKLTTPLWRVIKIWGPGLTLLIW